ncbi:MAG: type II secretion system major pseudopilin GspG [Gammaproteobacteria bacterium]|nr:type II secretion system major pseudopilin GspG [Gammaproteobacteria bacterium]
MKIIVDSRRSASPSLARFKPERGFTLIEVMVVVVILGILGALIVPNIISRPDEAKVIAAKTDIQQLGVTLGMYRLDNGFYPSTEQGLEALVEEPNGFPEPRHWAADGYLSKIPVDPWDEPYLYINEGRNIEVYSYGADRQEGGESFDADLYLSEF